MDATTRPTNPTLTLLLAAGELRFDADALEDEYHCAGLHGPSGSALRRYRNADALDALRQTLLNPPVVTVTRNDAPAAYGCEAWVARRRQLDGTHQVAFGPTVEAAMLTLVDGIDRRDMPCGYVPTEADVLRDERDAAFDRLDQAGVSL